MRVLCGFYGLLRPLDLIQPYRLEMNQRGLLTAPKLAEFWRPWFSQALASSPLILNLASQEYFAAIDDDVPATAGIFHCEFRDDGKIKSVYAKRARGLMARFVIEHQVQTIAKVQTFDAEGYRYHESLSKDKTLVFCRKGGPPPAQRDESRSGLKKKAKM